MKTVLIEDIIQLSKSSLEVVTVLIRSRLEMCELLSIFNYGLEEAGEAFNNANVS